MAPQHVARVGDAIDFAVSVSLLSTDCAISDASVTLALPDGTPQTLTTTLSLSPGGSMACGIDRDGVTRCWGFGDRGELGDGNTLRRSAPVEVSRDFVAVSTGGDHACGLTAAGGVRCWGADTHGQLGDGTAVNSAVPRDVAGLASGVKAISAGDEHSCALLQDGSVQCWGNAGSGRLGDGSTSDDLTAGDLLLGHECSSPEVVELHTTWAARAAGRPNL